MIRQPNTVDGVLVEADYQLMVGLTNALPNPPNYPTAISMSSLLRHDMVLIDDGAFVSQHRNVDRGVIVGRYLLPADIPGAAAWELTGASWIAVGERWPETLDWPLLQPFSGRSNSLAVVDFWVRFFQRWPEVSERGKKIDDDDMGYSLYWPKLRYAIKLARNLDGP